MAKRKRIRVRRHDWSASTMRRKTEEHAASFMRRNPHATREQVIDGVKAEMQAAYSFNPAILILIFKILMAIIPILMEEQNDGRSEDTAEEQDSHSADGAWADDGDEMAGD